MKTGILLVVGFLTPTILMAAEQVSLASGDAAVLHYQAEPLSDPKGSRQISADKFKASHFIHPLKTPSGFVLTESQPWDHLHHFGLWWPWKYIQNGDRKLVTRELQAGEGYVRATKCRMTDRGIVAEAEYVDRLAEGGAEVLLKETATLTVSETTQQPAAGYFLDISIAQTPAVDRDVTVAQYRYSGFSLRGTLYWTNKNSSLLTSQGKNRRNGNSTRARWMRFQGSTPSGGHAGFVMMSHPDNHNHPEQIRIWNHQSHHGAPFVNFNPVMSEPWVLQPGKTYTRNYRLFVYDGEVSPRQADEFWKEYASSKAALLE
jgi:hypothetical protein